jgi:hypothetical protein
MKIAIFGYPRSGTTMLHNIIAQHLVAAGVVESWAGLGEVFNPLDGTRLLLSFDGHLRNLTGLNTVTTQSREDRLQLFREHLDDDYIIKMLPYDTRVQEVVETVMQAGYNIIAIERRNPLSAYLSVIIGYHHQVWHAYGDEQPVYEPFVATEKEMLTLGKSLSMYYHLRDHMNPSAILYYEDIVMNSVESTLKELGLYHDGIPTKESPTKKLLSFEEKTKLIINLEEVVDHFTGILTPYMVTMEHNKL